MDFAKQHFASVRKRARETETHMTKRKKQVSELVEAELARKQAVEAIGRGDQAAADRWLKTAEKLAIVAERIGAAKAANPFPENVEEIRAQLRARIARFVGAAHDVQEWEKQRDIRDAVAAFARAHNLPEPPPVGPPPFTEHELELTGEGKYYPFSSATPLVPEGTRRFLGLPIED